MKRLILAVLAAASLAAVFALGANYIVNKGQSAALAAEELKASGVVESVDAAKGVLVIKAKGSDETLTLDAKAEQLKNLNKEDKVKVRYTAGDNNTVTYIRRIGAVVQVGC